MHKKYTYDGKKVAVGVWILVMVYAIGTLDYKSSGVLSDAQGWLHLIIYGAVSGLVLWGLLLISRDETQE